MLDLNVNGMTEENLDYKEFYTKEVNDEQVPKRKRFFKDNQSDNDLDHVVEPEDLVQDVNSFKSQLESVVGSITDELAEELEKRSDGDLQAAINLYFDKSQKVNLLSDNSEITPNQPQDLLVANSGSLKRKRVDAFHFTPQPPPQPPQPQQQLSPINLPQSPTPQSQSPWNQRYAGSFQAEVWATRSGYKLVEYQEKLSVERSNYAMAQSNTINNSNAHSKEDFIVRISNSKGQDFARLSESDARIVSILIDTEVCNFTATCIYSDTYIRTGSYVIIQVDCFILRNAFYKDLVLPQSANRILGKRYYMNSINNFDNTRENGDEKIMRLRQLALSGLFNKLGLGNGDDDNDGGEPDLVKATQLMDSTVNSDDEEVKEVTEDDLDSLYKRSEPPDTYLDPIEAESTFSFQLRPYQKKGLNWMMQKESPIINSSQSDDNNEPMHPLWQEVIWPETPSNQVNDQQYPEGNCFYANLYSGELSLKFPTQKKSVLGGILADEMGLGKTISSMALIHSSKDTNLRNFKNNYLHNTTLVIAPMSLLSQWESEAFASSHDGTVKVLVYYGSSTTTNLQEFSKSDDDKPKIIITSYGTVVSQHADLLRFRKINGYDTNDDSWQDSEDLKFFDLYYNTFYRIILDEGHTIKNRNTKTAKACYQLRSEKKWVLTGTPIVNKLEDLYSIIKFLGVEPWNNFNFWRSFITKPFESKGYVKALNVVQSVMEPLVLRRTKSMKQPDGKPLVELPPKTVTIQKVQFSEDEQVLYSYIFARVKSSFDKKLEQGSVMKSYSAILSQILRLRQTCCHPSLVWSKLSENVDLDDDMITENNNSNNINNTQDDSNLFNLQNTDLKEILDRFEENTDKEQNIKQTYGIEVMKSILEDSNKECPICTTEPIPNDNLAVTECFHLSCLSCILEHVDYQKKKNNIPKCPTCRAVINPKRIYQVHKNGDSSTLSLYTNCKSSKLRSLIASLKAEQEGLNGKSVVFSQFTSYLDLIESELKLNSIQTLRFDGRQSQAQRTEALNQFKNDPNKRVLLISLKAGGVGLNLVCAQNAYMMDPWWSYAIESQAIDRIHRMGQTSDVKVIRYIVEGTVEERMLKIQDRKKFLASSTLGMSEEEKKAQRLDDIRMLFE